MPSYTQILRIGGVGWEAYQTCLQSFLPPSCCRHVQTQKFLALTLPVVQAELSSWSLPSREVAKLSESFDLLSSPRLARSAR